MRYRATLFRGWEIVRLEYVLEDEAVVQRRHRTWRGVDVTRVELHHLTGEVRRVWGRQPAYLWSTLIVVALLLVLGIDAMIRGVGAGGSPINWMLWMPLLLAALVAGFVRVKVKKSAEWSHFVGNEKGQGLYVLVDPKNRKAHAAFVDALRERLS